MFKHYLLTIFRILSRNKLNLFLNFADSVETHMMHELLLRKTEGAEDTED